jgi:hypothetical protein
MATQGNSPQQQQQQWEASFMEGLQAILPDARLSWYQGVPAITVFRDLTPIELQHLEEYLALRYNLRPTGRPLN